jgi:hypothetical protein
MKADKTNFWKSQSSKGKNVSKAETARETMISNRKAGATRTTANRTEEYVIDIFYLVHLWITIQGRSEYLEASKTRDDS